MAKGVVFEDGKARELDCVEQDGHKFAEGEMSVSEKQMIMMIVEKNNVPPDERWKKEAESIEGADGVTYCDITRFVREKGLVEAYLAKAYPFYPVPALGDVRLDLHSGKKFRVGSCRFIVYADRVMAVSPEFYKSGGTVLDWVVPEDVRRLPNGDIVMASELKEV